MKPRILILGPPERADYFGPYLEAVREDGAADRIGPLEIVARAADGLIEGLEHPAHPFLAAVPWHPENLAAGHAPSKGLFEGFVEACRK